MEKSVKICICVAVVAIAACACAGVAYHEFCHDDDHDEHHGHDHHMISDQVGHTSDPCDSGSCAYHDQELYCQTCSGYHAGTCHARC